MTNAVACRAFQENCVFDLALPGGGLEDDVLNTILYAHRLSAETHHRRSEEKVFMFAIRIECLLYL